MATDSSRHCFWNWGRLVHKQQSIIQMVGVTVCVDVEHGFEICLIPIEFGERSNHGVTEVFG